MGIVRHNFDVNTFNDLYKPNYSQFVDTSVAQTKQTYTSKDTSISVVNRVYTHMDFQPQSVILDYGGGKYDKNIEYMKTRGCKVVIYDPYNRSEEYNQQTLAYIKQVPIRYIVCSNVLNVIKENNIVADVLRKMQGIQKAQQGPCDIYIAIYEGNKSGKGAITNKGYQRNEKLAQYLSKIYQYFDKNKVEVKDNIIICSK